MSTTEQQQHSEEVQLAASLIAGFGGPDRSLRDDRPDLTGQLEGLKQKAEALNTDLSGIKGAMSLLTAQLLPDAELTRLAQVARDIRDDTLPEIDADVSSTPCPTWCEDPDHSEDRVGKYHEGAVLDFDAAGPGGGTSPRVRVSVLLDQTVGPLIDVCCEASALTGSEAERLSAGIERAVQLWNQLGGAR